MILKLDQNEDVVEISYRGQVVDIVEFKANRNFSPTLDYTDYRMTNCVHAIVWIGERDSDGKPLLPWEQFKRIDCTNIFTGVMTDFSLHPQKTPFSEAINPIMFMNYIAYKNFIAKEKEEALKAEADRAEKIVEKERKKESALNKRRTDSHQQAQKDLKTLPDKGTTIPKLGTVFYKGVKLQNNSTYIAIIGVKTPQGLTKWLNVKQYSKYRNSP